MSTIENQGGELTGGFTRRDFVRRSLAAAAVATLAGRALPAGAQAAPTTSPVPRVPAAGKKSILILGGTAFLGPAIVRAAVERGHVVTLFNRGRTRPGLFPELEKLQGDRDGKLEALVGRKWDAVIDTSGYVPRVVKMSAELLAPNVGQYLFVSSLSAYVDRAGGGEDGGTGRQRLTEASPVQTLPEPESEEVMRYFGPLKAACERAAEAAMPGRVTNVRPGLIVGPDDPSDRYTYWPVRMDRGGEVLCPGDGSDAVQYIDARDLGLWLVKAVEQNATGVFNAVGPTGPEGKHTMRELVDACETVAGKKATQVWVPAEFVLGRGVQPWMELTVWTAGGMGIADCTKAIAAGLTFRDPKETARDTLAWWKGLPETRRARVRAGLKAEKEAAVLRAWKEGGGE